jgi:hypothetical protein
VEEIAGYMSDDTNRHISQKKSTANKTQIPAGNGVVDQSNSADSIEEMRPSLLKADNRTEW